MDWLGPVVGAVVQIILFFWSPVSRQIGYPKDLNHNMDNLKRETEELRCMRDGVQTRVDHSVSAGMTRFPLVQNWLEKAGSAVADVDSIRLEVERRRTRCGCVDLNSRRRLGKRVVRKINDAEKLKGKEDFSEVAESPCRSQMLDQMQVPQQLQQQRSPREALKEISLWLKDELVAVICVWGMGGIGKTTLVKEIYTRFNATKDFHQVIWVTVSKDLDLEVIQKRIGKKLCNNL